MKYQLFDVVELTEALPEKGLCAGDRGAIVEIFTKPREGYEVEFDGFVLVGLAPQQIALVARNKTAANV